MNLYTLKKKFRPGTKVTPTLRFKDDPNYGKIFTVKSIIEYTADYILVDVYRGEGSKESDGWHPDNLMVIDE